MKICSKSACAELKNIFHFFYKKSPVLEAVTLLVLHCTKLGFTIWLQLGELGAGKKVVESTKLPPPLPPPPPPPIKFAIFSCLIVMIVLPPQLPTTSFVCGEDPLEVVVRNVTCGWEDDEVPAVDTIVALRGKRISLRVIVRCCGVVGWGESSLLSVTLARVKTYLQQGGHWKLRDHFEKGKLRPPWQITEGKEGGGNIYFVCV